MLKYNIMNYVANIRFQNFIVLMSLTFSAQVPTFDRLCDLVVRAPGLQI
jgi:hypothetical protein